MLLSADLMPRPRWAAALRFQGAGAQRMGFVISGAVLFALVLVAANTYLSVRRELTEATMARRLAIAQLAATAQSERIDRVVDLGVSLATRVRFAELVSAGDWDAALGILQGVPARFPFIERLFLADLDGVLRADVPALPGVRGRNFADRDWYQGLRRSGQPYVSSMYRRSASPQRNFFSIAVPVANLEGRATGILVIEVRPAPFFAWAADIDFGPGGEMGVVDRVGQEAFSSRGPDQNGIRNLSDHPVVRSLLAGRSAVELAADPVDGQETLYAYMPTRQGWGVIARQPAALAFAARENQLSRLVIGYALILVLFASTAGLALRAAARRRESERRFAERLRILHGIDRAVIDGEAPEAIAAAVIQPVRELLGVPRAIVNRFDLAAGEVEWIAAAGRRRIHAGPGVRYSIRLMGDVEALQRGEPQVVDTRALPAGPETEALLASGVEVYMVVPMIAGGELIGALSFGGKAEQFPPEQLRIAQEIAAQLSISMAMAKLVATVRHHANELEGRVRERTALLESAMRELEDLYNRAPCGYHSVDASGLIVRMNDTWLAWLGYERDEVVGRLRHSDLMTPASAKRFVQEAFPLFLSRGTLQDVEFDYRRKDGSILTASLNASSIYDEAGRYVMSRSTVFDITERRKNEETIRALNKELEGFSYSVSHDLRAPLRAVDGYARMLEEDYAPKLDDEGRRFVSVIRASAVRMGQLIDDLLDFSRLGRQSMARGEVDFEALVREVLGELQPGSAVEIVVGALPPARGDRALLKQVWMNLLGNALKYSGKRERPRVEVGARAEDGKVVYWVQDNGAGFDMRYAAKLFGVFQRLHSQEDFPGTGVGLAIVQRVVSRHGGRAWADGKPGAGACFFFSLPTDG